MIYGGPISDCVFEIPFLTQLSPSVQSPAVGFSRLWFDFLLTKMLIQVAQKISRKELLGNRGSRLDATSGLKQWSGIENFKSSPRWELFGGEI
jgi:hypothetical protein